MYLSFNTNNDIVYLKVLDVKPKYTLHINE